MSDEAARLCPYCEEPVSLDDVICSRCHLAIGRSTPGYRFRRTIEAVPAGRFRSQLEQRWYRVLDLAGLRPEYEAHSFLDLRVPYVPDFYLSTLRLWLEIKPRLADDEAREKARLLSERTREPVVIVCGPPERESGFVNFAVIRFDDGRCSGPDWLWMPQSLFAQLEPADGRTNWELVSDQLYALGLLAEPIQTGAIRVRREAARREKLADVSDDSPDDVREHLSNPQDGTVSVSGPILNYLGEHLSKLPQDDVAEAYRRVPVYLR